MRLAAELTAASTRRDAAATISRWSCAFPPAGDRAVSAPPNDWSAPAIEAEGGVGPVGIWFPRMIDGERWFVREADPQDAALWADVERIGPKRSARRVVLLGESCARGYPFDPLFTCAAALSAYLGGDDGHEAADVVDLAQSGIGPQALIRLLQQSVVLEPDLLVVFAGNNWEVGAGRLDFRAVVDGFSAEKRWGAVAAAIDTAVRAQIEEWVASIAQISRDAGVPVVFVIPAENMRECPLPRNVYNPVLSPADQEVRERLLVRVRSLTANHQFSEAETLASQVVELEQGFSMAGLQALAECALARGATHDAEQLYEAARETLLFLPVYGLTSYRIRTEVLRTRGTAEGFEIVDLPRILFCANGDVPAGRESFLDNCHMTSSAIRTAMAATAARVRLMLGLQCGPSEALVSEGVPVEPRAEAQAHFIAAQLHVAHDEELAGYHIAAALDATREIAEVMRHYADLRMRRMPYVLCDSYHRLKELEARFGALRHLSLARPFHPSDVTLMRIITKAVALEYPRARAECEALLQRRHSVHREGADLLAYTTDECHSRLPRHRKAFAQHFRRRVEFHVIGDAVPTALRLRLTTRVRRHGFTGGDASLFVGGNLVLTWAPRVRWNTVECTIGPEAFQPGENLVTIVWPEPRQDSADRQAQISEAFGTMKLLKEGAPQLDLLPELYTVYGEVADFTCSIAEDQR